MITEFMRTIYGCGLNNELRMGFEIEKNEVKQKCRNDTCGKVEETKGTFKVCSACNCWRTIAAESAKLQTGKVTRCKQH